MCVIYTTLSNYKHVYCLVKEDVKKDVMVDCTSKEQQKKHTMPTLHQSTLKLHGRETVPYLRRPEKRIRVDSKTACIIQIQYAAYERKPWMKHIMGSLKKCLSLNLLGVETRKKYNKVLLFYYSVGRGNSDKYLHLWKRTTNKWCCLSNNACIVLYMYCVIESLTCKCTCWKSCTLFRLSYLPIGLHLYLHHV